MTRIQGKLERLSTDNNGRLSLKDLPVDRGPQILRVRAVPKKPTEIWHGAETWQVEISELPLNALLRKMLEIKVHARQRRQVSSWFTPVPNPSR